MTPTETAAILRQFNNWCRDPSDFPASPMLIEKAIDAAIAMIDRLEEAESDALEQARLNGMGSEREAALMAKLEAVEQERDALRAELETERMRLTACGVVALSNTPDSAKWARDIRPEYWSASCGDVARTVDENIKLRAKIATMEKQEPVAIVDYKRGSCIRWVEYLGWQKIKDGAKLYALPGVKGE